MSGGVSRGGEVGFCPALRYIPETMHLFFSLRLRAAACVAVVLLLAGCATLREPAGPSSQTEGVELSPLQHRVAQSALSLVGRRVLRIDGRRFRYDCTGTILAAHYAAGIDLEKRFREYTGNGVARLYKLARAEDLLAGDRTPRPGDILFWDNTYDRNGDEAWNDPLTHAGIVVRAYPDGRIDYVHHNYREGIVVARMNLSSPDTHHRDGTLVNSPMRMKSHRHLAPSKWLSSHLYRTSGRLHEL